MEQPNAATTEAQLASIATAESMARAAADAGVGLPAEAPRIFATRDFLIDLADEDDLVWEEVYVPEWKRWFRVRSPRAKDRDAWEDKHNVSNEQGVIVFNFANARADLIVMCVCDEKGRRVYTDEDAVKLGERNSLAIQRLWRAASRLSGIGEEARKNLEKNFERTGDADSATPSPVR